MKEASSAVAGALNSFAGGPFSQNFQSRILWLQGFAEQALRVVLSFCSVLGQGHARSPFGRAISMPERYGAMLLDHTERHPIRLWHIRAAA
jgi:hypothetical protein